MPTYLTPGIYVEEVEGGPRPIESVGTSVAGFVGQAPDLAARPNEPVAITNWSQFVRVFCPEGATSTPLSNAVYGFFLNGGSRCYVVNTGKSGALLGSGGQRAGLEVLEPIDEVAIVAAPGQADAAAYDALLTHCETLQDRVAILDPAPETYETTKLTEAATSGGGGARPRLSEGGYGAFYVPNITVRDPLSGELVDVPPSGHIAGIWARSDAVRGVHKAPANETVRGALNVAYRFSAAEQGELNSAGVNCIRLFSREGVMVWGARTLADSSSEWRYLNVRRLVAMVRESIADGTRWIVFQPNNQTLWKSIRRDIGAFLTRLWRDGALLGRTPDEAFFVKCDEETNPPETIDQGMVVTLIGFAPVKPAEFIVFRLSQFAGGAAIEGATSG
jgi:phage tail sheath protein FI